MKAEDRKEFIMTQRLSKEDVELADAVEQFKTKPMKCTNCKKEIEDESKKVLINIDGDFACSFACAKDYEKRKDEFLNNIGNDDWYYRNYRKFKLNQ